MLREWLSPQPIDDFVRKHLRRLPYARPNAVPGLATHFDWDVLERLLSTRPQPDILIASKGRLVDAPAPRCVRDVRALMQNGLGVVLRKTERHDGRLAELARAFAEDLPGEVHVQLYVTPAGTQTFGWHFDEEDVFIAQTAGIKDYYFRENTVSPRQPLCVPDFSAVERETSPLMCSRLIAGDWLYVPARWWHLVHSVEDALSISIGVIPKLEREVAAQAL